MPTLVATAGGASSNSYVTVSDADTYFDERLGRSAWTGKSTDDKERGLIQATRRLDQEKFEGIKNTEGQALKWPRYNATDDDGDEFDEATIPQIIKDATCEVALDLLIASDDGDVPLTDTGLEEYRSAKIGPLEMERLPGFDAGQLPANVMRLLRPVLITPSNTVRMGTAY